MAYTSPYSRQCSTFRVTTPSKCLSITYCQYKWFPVQTWFTHEDVLAWTGNVSVLLIHLIDALHNLGYEFKFLSQEYSCWLCKTQHCAGHNTSGWTRLQPASHHVYIVMSTHLCNRERPVHKTCKFLCLLQGPNDATLPILHIHYILLQHVSAALHFLSTRLSDSLMMAAQGRQDTSQQNMTNT